MKGRRWVFFVGIIAGCGSDITVTEKSICDGQLGAGEETVDDVFDLDGDGFFDGANPGCAATYPASSLDCDDGDASVHPGAAELPCDGIDNDCDAATTDADDLDGDGFTCDDCNNTDSLVFPGATEVPCNGIDDDCDAATADEADVDGDGFSSCEDCDDTTGQRSPGLTEVACDGIDNDCNDATLDDPDGDADGVGVCTDCDDADRDRSPEEDEICDDGIDNNCSGEVDEDCQADYSGIWTLDSAVRLSCAGGAVNINTASLVIEDYYPAIRATMGTAQPGTMNGNFTSETVFFAGRTIAGTCTEDYLLDGAFTSETELTATLTVTFTDTYGWGLCFDCTSTSFTFTATR